MFLGNGKREHRSVKDRSAVFKMSSRLLHNSSAVLAGALGYQTSLGGAIFCLLFEQPQIRMGGAHVRFDARANIRDPTGHTVCTNF